MSSSSACGQLRIEVTRNNNKNDTNSDGSEIIFWPGDKINVRVSYVLFEYRDIESIRVFLIGEEHTNLYNCKPDASQGTNNIFLYYEKCLPSSPNMNQTNFFNFTMKLPKNASSTYSNKKGWVKYFIRACLFVNPGPQHKVQKEIIVGSSVDFNRSLEAIYIRPVTMVTEKEVRAILYFFVHRITMDVHFPKRAFVLGEQAKITVDIYNMSNKNIKRLELKLGQTITMKTSPWQNAVRHEEEEVLAVEEIKGIVPVPLYNKQHYEFMVYFPSSAKIPNFSCCRLFDCTSWVKVIAYFGNCKVKMVAPIALGHIPLEGGPIGREFRPLPPPELYKAHYACQDEAAAYTKCPSTYSTSSGDSCRSSKPLITDSPQELPPSYDTACRQSSPGLQAIGFTETQGFASPSRRPSKSKSPQRSKSPYGALYPPPTSDKAEMVPTAYKSTPYPLESSRSFPKPLPSLGQPENHIYHNQSPYQIGFSPNVTSYPLPKEENFPSTLVPISCLLFTPGSEGTSQTKALDGSSRP